MAQWRKWTKASEDIRSGDIVETVTKLPEHSPVLPGLKVPFIKHYGMVVTIDEKKYIIHNIIGRYPMITPIEEVFKDRKIHRLLRTGMSDQEILSKYDSCKNSKYKLFSWNCETLMSYIWGSAIGFPQQNGWMMGLSMLVIIIIIIFILLWFKRT